MAHTHRLFLVVVFSLAFTQAVCAQEVSRDALRQELEAKGAEMAALEKQFLAPSAADRAEFAALLNQPYTGLVRLLPREKYDGDITKNKKTLTLRGGGAYYSFARNTHEYGGSDIELNMGHLSVGFAGADYGMLLKLGDIAIEDVAAELPAVRTLLEYAAATNEPAARIEHRRFSNGAELAGFFFKDRLPLETHAMYILRSINYRSSDVAVAFRVVRKDTDGSAIIAFKVLKKFSVPNLARN